MVAIEILESLYEQIDKKFKRDAIKVYSLMESLKSNPGKGKALANVGGIVIKELKYRSFRFNFVADGQKLKLMTKEALIDLLIKFVRMSDKAEQQKTIEEIKYVLKKMGFDEFR